MLLFAFHRYRANSHILEIQFLTYIAYESEPEMVVEFIKLAATLKVIVYAKEVEQVLRMNRRDETNKKPGPVLLTLARNVLRDTILKKKGNLGNTPGFDGVFINADEPFEVRRAKSFLRKAAYHGRKQGENVLFQHNQLTINDKIFTTENYNKIPAKFLGPSAAVDQGEKLFFWPH